MAMEQQSSTSKVTVEYFDPHDVYKLLAPGLVPRLPLHNLHWQSHAGPLRSIEALHVELVQHGNDVSTTGPSGPTPRPSGASRDDGFQTQNIGGQSNTLEVTDTASIPAKTPGSQRRHQIPGLRRTPYLKVLFVRCDDNDSYKSSVRSEVRDWVKAHTPQSGGSKKGNSQENHDAFEWLIVHVIIPNTVAATQPRSSSKAEGSVSEKTSSRWRTGSTPLMEKFRSDFNGSAKTSPDRVAQIRIGINDVPYDLLPRVVPAVPSGYSENEQDAENAWTELIGKFKSLILCSFDSRVTQYEDDIKEKDAQRSLPGWNFCTFFILKEGLARGFENVGLVEDSLVGYDELSAGLDAVIHEQVATGSPESHGGSLLPFTKELQTIAKKAFMADSDGEGKEVEAVDMQACEPHAGHFDDMLISSTKKPYRDMILENKVSVFDFHCYIFSRQVTLLLRLGNASSTREELALMLKQHEESILHGEASRAPSRSNRKEETENLAMFAEICRRTLQFIPSVSQILRRDVVAAIQETGELGETGSSNPLMEETVENIVASFAFSVAQQILAQTSTKSLPIPPSSLSIGGDQEQKVSIPEPKTMMHPARNSSLNARGGSRPPPSPGIFPGPGRQAIALQSDGPNTNNFLKAGLEDLAAKRAELYMLSRSVLTGLGKKRGWHDGWAEAPMMGETNIEDMEDVSLDDGNDKDDANSSSSSSESTSPETEQPKLGTECLPSLTGIDSHVLRIAIQNSDDFYRLYEILTDKAMRHFTVANYDNAVKASQADLGVLKVHMKDYKTAAFFLGPATVFFGKSGWSLLELSMLTMYAKCLDEMQSKTDYVNIALTLLTKACAAERDRLRSIRHTGSLAQRTPDLLPLVGVVEKLCSLCKTVPAEAKVPLTNFFTDVELAGPPKYRDGQDSCSLTINLRSLLPETINLDTLTLKLSCTDGGPCKELVFTSNKTIIGIAPGKNSVNVNCNSVVPGSYWITHLGLRSNNILLHFEQDAGSQQITATDIFRYSEVVLFQRASAFDAKVMATRHTALDKNNSLDLELNTGWNTVKSCEVRVKPATGGLRFLTTEAKFVGPEQMEFAKPPEAGVFYFAEIAAETSVTMRFPYTVEQDVGDVFARLEATYVTDSGETFYLAKALTIPVSLAVGVNVQDVFKHNALFSRFNVSTASSSPLRLCKSELLSSDLFESDFGAPPAGIVTVFPKQAASLAYKIRRKPGAKASQQSGKTMYLKLDYSVLDAEIEELMSRALVKALTPTSLAQYSRLIVESLLNEVRKEMQPRDLERAALLGDVSTAFLDGVAWESRFSGLGKVPGTNEDAAKTLSLFLEDWRKTNPFIAIPASSIVEPSSILIPVEIPSLSVVHTADIRLKTPVPSPIEDATTDGGATTPVVCTNQILPATLHLKWTRIWDTEPGHKEDQEFSYDVTAPADTWLLGGRRKGHFVIPGVSSSADEAASSTPETEAEIPLVLIPLREGWLPYPSVEIREISAAGAALAADTRGDGSAVPQGCEVDMRNLGETVRVVSGLRSLTVSLDASGPGGGPLVFESDGILGYQGRIVA